ncbi:MAG: hypothetical protein G01um1014106_376 [Parcubacteria group bacterium Gr01-1014_106]|nr:MAG: hypothetical protein G01um1014106_376 [Parcubacteria group bacterium Gr01-1014_106]
MLTPFAKRILAALAFILGAGILVVVLILFTPAPAPADPKITWAPESLTEEIGRGQSKTISVAFTTSEDISNVTVRVVPALQPFIQVSPSALGTVGKGQTFTLNIALSAAADSPFTTFDGTIQLRGKATLAKPLPITLKVVPVSPEEVLGELVRRLRDGDVPAASELMVGPERKLAKLDTASPTQLAALADFYANGVLVEEIGALRIYRSFLTGAPSELTFQMQRDPSGRWRISL